MTDLPSLGQTVRVGRLAVTQAYNAPNMFYRAEPFRLESYDQHRWRVTPGDLVTDFLLRDLRSAGLFRAVFSYRDAEGARFVVEGGVEEFLEVDGSDGPRAVLGLHVTLLDTSQQEVTRRVVFQRGYRAEEPLSDRTAPALAQGMSRAMEGLSRRILRDLHEAAAPLAR
jgi:cholesterol transport system auxiliary component